MNAPTQPSPSGRRPPTVASRLLTLSLGESAEAQAILGDLFEDFTRIAERRGLHEARWWYWREAVLLSVTVRRSTREQARASVPSLGVPSPGVPAPGRHSSRSTMSNFFHPVAIALDARYALRAVGKDLRLFVFAVLIIGLGVGACTAVFSILGPLLIRELPFEDASRLVWIANDREGGMSAVTSRTFNLRDFRARSQSFDGITGFDAFFEQQSHNLVGEGEPLRLMGVPVVANFLDVLGVRPVVGRSFAAEEGRWGGPKAIVLSHAFWMRQFDGDPRVVGTSITLGDEPTEVVGVLPPSFDFASTFAPTTRVDFLRPFAISEETDREGNTLSMIGRLRAGATVDSAQADLERVMQGLRDEDPERRGLGAVVTGLQPQISGPFRSALLLLAAGAGTIMLIVCVNLSNLLLAKSVRRRSEMAVRSALGASRSRLIRQMLFESLMLATSGALCGTIIALAATRYASHASGLGIPLLRNVSIDGGALLFSAALAVLVGVVVGVVPAMAVASRGGASAFRGSRRGMSGSRKSRRLREGLVIAEVALAAILLVLGGLLLRSFHNVLDVDLGFDPDEVTAWQINVARPFETLTERAAFFDQLVTQVQAVPGVQAVGLTDTVPLGRNRSWGLSVPGRMYGDQSYLATFPYMIDQHYFQTMQIPLVAGRGIAARDTEDSQLIVVLNETAARLVLGGEDPMGRAVWIGDTEIEVVGVVADTRHQSLEMGAGPQMYFSHAQVGQFISLDMVVRSRLPVDVLAQGVVGAIHAVAPNIPMNEYQTLSSVVDRSVSPRRFTLQLLVAFALSALLLAALGIYGVLSYAVTERIPEIGIRMALGETSGGVLRRVVGHTLALASIGLALGAAGSLAVSRWVASLLYSVEPSDPGSFLAMAVVLLAVAALAGWLPALRASRTQVASVLRSNG